MCGVGILRFHGAVSPLDASTPTQHISRLVFGLRLLAQKLMPRTKSKMSATKAASGKPATPKSTARKEGRRTRENADAPQAPSKQLPAKASPKASKPPGEGEAANGEAQLQSLGQIKSQSGVELTEKIKELIRLAQ